MRIEQDGYCPICETKATFIAERDEPLPERYIAHWTREHLRCTKCKSPPRERALAQVIEQHLPGWREARIHECSPGGWALSPKIRRQCVDYVPTQFDPSMPFGTLHSSGGWQNENLEDLTFQDEEFDVFIAQDVFEHVFHPDKAIREVARTLRPGGFVFMTVPVVNRFEGETVRRASLIDGEVQHHLPEIYHGNPVGDGKALVTVDWSLDIGAYLSHHAGMPLMAMIIDDMRIGSRDVANVVIFGRKTPLAQL